ncbi:LOW QUALITY PROTEIN: putative transcriptional regulator, GntR family protein, partial [Streptomyces himastatinicus ATCC 53653]
DRFQLRSLSYAHRPPEVGQSARAGPRGAAHPDRARADRAGGGVQRHQLAEELGVSITPVREAVMDLAHHGMVEVIRNRGFRVPVLGEHDLDEIFRIRTLLEAPAMADVVQALDGAPVPQFRRLAEEITAAARDGDLAVFLDKDRQFHLGLLELLGNRRLVTMVAQLR